MSDRSGAFTSRRRSPYFNALLHGPWKEKDQSEVGMFSLPAKSLQITVEVDTDHITSEAVTVALKSLYQHGAPGKVESLMSTSPMHSRVNCGQPLGSTGNCRVLSNGCFEQRSMPSHVFMVDMSVCGAYCGQPFAVYYHRSCACR